MVHTSGAAEDEEETLGKNCIEIPLRDTNEVIALDCNSLPSGVECLNILRQEKSRIIHWVNLALEYYMKGRLDEFVLLLENSLKDADIAYEDSEKDHLRALDLLACHYTQSGNKEKNKELKAELFNKASTLLNSADKVMMYDQGHLLSRAYLRMLEGDKMEQADSQFNFILNYSAHSIPALLGKACIFYNKKDYKGALAYYKRVIRHKPNVPGAVRVGLAHCYLKLGNEEKARLAFERALSMDPNCVPALAGMAIMHLNMGTPLDIRNGVNKLSQAYSIDQSNPIVLNHLADHFFFKQDFNKTQHLALHAFHKTENEPMRAESCYQMARAYHAMEDYEQAFQYYYQASQFAPSNYVLPHYGLGQMYIYKNDFENAAINFEKVLKMLPNNHETMKMLGSLYANVDNQAKREMAKTFLKKVTDQNPDDVEAWIEYAQILEQSDLQGALKCYNTAVKLLNERKEAIKAELWNNIATLNYRLGNLEESKNLYIRAMELAKKDGKSSEGKNSEHRLLTPISIVVAYNLARVFEAMCQTDRAEALYKCILKEHPNYIDCYLGLGRMAKSRNQIYEASDWFKEVLSLDTENPDAWTLIGNLHFTKNEWGPGQKKFERILKHYTNDPFALIALGNVWLDALQQPNKDKEKIKAYLDRAKKMYEKAMKADPANIYAAHGIGTILAHQGYFNEARDIFSLAREATADFCDVWLNIAHIYVEQKQYISAIQMYENCMKKFYKCHDVEVLQYLGRAYYKAGKYAEAKDIFTKALKVAPHDTTVLYNIAMVMQKQAMSVLKEDKSSLEMVLKAVHELGLSHRYFQYLSVHGDRLRFNLRVADRQAKQCHDLMSQAQYHVARARRVDEEEKIMRKKQEEEREAIRLKNMQEKERLVEMQRVALAEIIQKRHEYVEKKKGALVFVNMPSEKKAKGGGRGRKGDTVSDSDESPDEKGKHSGGEGKRIDSGSKTHYSERRGKKRRTGGSGSDSDKKKKIQRRKESKISKQQMKIVSKATISSSDSDSDSNKLEIAESRRSSRSTSASGGSASSRSSSRSSASGSGGSASSRSNSVDSNRGSRGGSQ